MFHDDQTGLDLLSFGADVWNAGPSPLVVEGFRRSGAAIMDAYQVFYAAGRPAGAVRIGTIAYHAGGGHDHWHFRDFARYDLTDATRTRVQTSGKESWCLAPTDAIDLTVPGADWHAALLGLHTSCGGPSALWIRETLPVGWGDTYTQFLSGQAFDISAVPNGTYYIKVTVNPNGRLLETRRSNDVSYRRIVLGGDPGARTVTVPPYRGIDTEGAAGPPLG